MTNEDIISAAITKYTEECKTVAGAHDQPSPHHSKLFTIANRNFVALRNAHRTLERYRVLEDGSLRKPNLEDQAALTLADSET